MVNRGDWNGSNYENMRSTKTNHKKNKKKKKKPESTFNNPKKIKFRGVRREAKQLLNTRAPLELGREVDRKPVLWTCIIWL